MTGRILFEEFSLLGGPLHRLGRRLGLVRGERDTLALGLALGLLLWLVLAALTVLEGHSQVVFSLLALGGHVRLLLVIPLFFLCESLLDPRIAAFIRTLVRSEVVPSRALPALESGLLRIGRWRDAWQSDALCLLAAAVFSAIAPLLDLGGTTAAADPGRVVAGGSLTHQWYLIVCLTVYRFLLFRWIWRYGLWLFLLWRISRLELKLAPSHPDGAAGLGYLEVVHAHFTPLILAISAVEAAMLAEEITLGTASLDAIYPVFALTVIVDAALFIGPLLLFAPRLRAARVTVMPRYIELGSRYVADFDRKWLGADPPTRELLGTPDLQSLADFKSVLAGVMNLRVAPVSLRLLKFFALAALVPLLPLVLLKVPVARLAERFVGNLTGL